MTGLDISPPAIAAFSIMPSPPASLSSFAIAVILGDDVDDLGFVKVSDGEDLKRPIREMEVGTGDSSNTLEACMSNSSD